jgi:hypothetical protein
MRREFWLIITIGDRRIEIALTGRSTMAVIRKADPHVVKHESALPIGLGDTLSAFLLSPSRKVVHVW